MKRSQRIFFRSLVLSSVIVFCLIFGSYGVFKAYEATRSIGYGDTSPAVALTEDGIRILDYEIEF